MVLNNYTVIILPQAEKDITEILDYISTELSNPSAAKNLWSDIKDSISRASLFPYAMPILKNNRMALDNVYRRIDVNNYVIIYKIIEEIKQIRIYAVFYGPSNIISKILNRI